MTGALAALGPDADKVQPMLITIDPERDTAPVLAQYVAQFDPRLIGLPARLRKLPRSPRNTVSITRR